MKDHDHILQNLLNFGLEISQIKDIDVLLEKYWVRRAVLPAATLEPSTSRKGTGCTPAIRRTTP